MISRRSGIRPTGSILTAKPQHLFGLFDPHMVFFSQICFNSRMISSLCSAGGPNYSIDFKLKISKKKREKKKKKLVGLWLGDFGIIERSRIANHKIIENCLVQARKLLYF